jgi:paraquat-inducible protein B
MPEQTLPAAVESRIVIKKRRRFSAVWLVPLFAAAVGLWVGITTIRNQGPKITIVFHTAEGLEEGKTHVRYNGIVVGELSDIQISPDHKTVIATAKMHPNTEPFLVKDTKFWVVRPQISGANITGLGTLISGAYVGVEIGNSKARQRSFVALDNPPIEIGDVHGRFFTLKTPELGSLDRGTPIYFRRLPAGQVDSYELDKDGKSLNVKVFVKSPYDQYVNPNTRFWHASGIDVSLTASGLHVQTESFLSIVVGGLAFETPANGPVLSPAEENAVFTLFRDRTEAFRPPARDPQMYTLVFKGSVRGLSVGAPVELDGITIGEVTDIKAQFDASTFEFSAPVTIKVDPARFGVQMRGMPSAQQTNQTISGHRKIIDTLVARGLRARLQTGSLISGSQFIALDFYPDEPTVALDWAQEPVQLPTLPGQMQSMEDKLEGIVKKLEELPLKEIGDDLHKTIKTVDKTLLGAQTTFTNVNKILISADKMIAPDSALDQQLSAMLEEVGGAARAMRLLTDYLERHPEALVRGKSSEGK